MRPGDCRRTLLAALSIAIALLAHCKRNEPDTASVAANDASALRIASANAFELVADNAGVTLVYAPAERTRGALLARALDADGFANGEPRVLASAESVPGAVEELAALRFRGALLVAFVERNGSRAELRALSQRNREVTLPVTVGPAHAVPSLARGNLALAADDRDAMLFARGGAAPCAAEATASCAGFRLYRMRDGKPDGVGLPLAVPEPCSAAPLVLALTPSRWRYGICSEQGGERKTTLFTIDHEPFYASARTELAGCTPLALSSWPERTLLVGDCGGRRSAIDLTQRSEAALPSAIGAPKIGCHAGVTRLALDAGRLELSQPRAGIESLLPEALASRSSRAAWSGRALVVATSTGERLSLARHACSAGIFSADRVKRR